jgi:hypothetical protein
MSGIEVYRKGITVERLGTMVDCASAIGISNQLLYRYVGSGDCDVDPVARIGNAKVYIIEEMQSWMQRKRWASTRQRTTTQYRGAT